MRMRQKKKRNALHTYDTDIVQPGIIRLVLEVFRSEYCAGNSRNNSNKNFVHSLVVGSILSVNVKNF